MPAGGFSAPGAAGGTEFEAKITPIVIISCIMAATGGLMFGYDVGVSGHFSLFLSQQHSFFIFHFHLYHFSTFRLFNSDITC